MGLLTLLPLKVCTCCHIILRSVDLIRMDCLSCSVVLWVVLHRRVVLHLSILLLPVVAALLVKVLIAHCSSEVWSKKSDKRKTYWYFRIVILISVGWSHQHFKIKQDDFWHQCWLRFGVKWLRLIFVLDCYELMNLHLGLCHRFCLLANKFRHQVVYHFHKRLETAKEVC